MSRHDRNLNAASHPPADLDELLRAIGNAAANRSADRKGAMAQFLSGSDGWRDARAALRGAFARASDGPVDGSIPERELTPGKDK